MVLENVEVWCGVFITDVYCAASVLHLEYYAIPVQSKLESETNFKVGQGQNSKNFC